MAMEAEIRGLDLEKELTCSICTEVLYQPLTVLDCLHTFCGSCLKEWFSWQLTASRNSPTPLPAGSTPYTCPSCRAVVRASRHDAKVTTLLEMFLAANPNKGKTDEEKSDLKKRYTPGEEVMPKVEGRDKSIRERRAADEDRRLVEEVRDLSLREVGVESPDTRREHRRREEAGLRTSRREPSREHSRDNRSGGDRETRRRREVRDDSSLRPDAESGEERRRRRSHEDSRRRHEETSRTEARQVEHQSSLRSLISSSDIDSQEMEEEILRQIREEGLLDGIDLENIDVSQEDQITERIAEAFRRRQSQRAREERERRRSNDQRRQTRSSAPESRETSGDDSSRTSRRRTHTRNSSAVSQDDASRRPPPALSASHAAHLEVRPSEERRRRRTTSGGRSSTAPSIGSQPQTRPAARSQTDLSVRSGSMDLDTSRSAITLGPRSSTESNRQQANVIATTSEQESRESQRQPRSSPRMRTSARIQELTTTASIPQTRRSPPTEIIVPAPLPSEPLPSPTGQSLMPAPLSPSHAPGVSLSDRAVALSSGSRPASSSSSASRNRAPLFPEPSLTCARCSKAHIEYELHYNCGLCHNGNYNICMSCFRSGKGCMHWFGFGYAAWARWEALSQSGDLPPDAEKPHMLIASRYIPPKASPGGADGRKTLTTEDPHKRLQSGTFCASCLAWANECYWRCDFCNEGDWGFCNLCVNQGNCCTHPLLPLTFKPPESDSPPLSPTHAKQMPSSATILTGPGVMDIGRFKPLKFSARCDICHYPIQSSNIRYHCFSCTSKVPNTQPGDYDICTTCYPKLMSSRRISAENGINGWRRCLEGHRMVILGFEDSRGGQRRVIVQDLPGGHVLNQEKYNSSDHPDLEKWSWADEKYVKLATNNVMDTPPITVPDLTIESNFPPDGGVGMSCFARWSWYPAANVDDELMFPKGAEVRECKEVNAEWWHGSYMGKTGLFPALYVRVLDKGSSS